MKATKVLFFELMYDFPSHRWNEFELPKLSLRDILGSLTETRFARATSLGPSVSRRR
jgi:hypothetical protein